MLVSVPVATGTPTVDAKGPKALVPCPKKGGTVVLRVKWYPDIQGERARCGSRSPRLAEDQYSGAVWLLESPTGRVDGSLSFHRDPRVSLAGAETALLRLIGSAEALSHPCVPPAEAMPSDRLSCPLLMPGNLVRSDCYDGDPPAVVAMDDGSSQRYQLVCNDQSAYADDDDTGFVWLEWYESEPGKTALCSARSIEKSGSTKYWRGYHPVAVEVSHEFAERRGGQALADALEAAAAARTSRCPDAPVDRPMVHQ